MNRARVTLILAAITAAAPAALAQLDPPPGPVGPSYKTLDQVEPSVALSQENTPGNAQALYVIDEPGAYHLTGNILLNNATTYCILITADGVNLDLRGYKVHSSGQAPTLIYGDYADRVTIRNGTLQADRLSNGIHLFASTACTIEDITVHHTLVGIDAGTNATVRNCHVHSSQTCGIKLRARSIALNCSATRVSSAPDAVGIDALEACIIKECTVSHWPMSGIRAGNSTRVIDCVATNCGFAGFQGIDGSRFSGCIASDNLGYGFFGMSGVSFTECTAESNHSHGFYVYEHCIVRDCMASRNGEDVDFGSGIFLAGNGNTIHRNTVSDNDSRGILGETHYNVVAENHAYGHGGTSGNIFIRYNASNFLSLQNLVGERNADPNGNYPADQ